MKDRGHRNISNATFAEQDTKMTVNLAKETNFHKFDNNKYFKTLSEMMLSNKEKIQQQQASRLMEKTKE